MFEVKLKNESFSACYINSYPVAQSIKPLNTYIRKEETMETKKILLSEDEMPRQWYNILADIKMNPPLGPDGPITPDMLAPVFPMNLIEQEVSSGTLD